MSDSKLPTTGTKDPVPSNSVKWRDKRKSSPTTQKPNLKVLILSIVAASTYTIDNDFKANVLNIA